MTLQSLILRLNKWCSDCADDFSSDREEPMDASCAYDLAIDARDEFTDGEWEVLRSYFASWPNARRGDAALQEYIMAQLGG